MSELPEKHRPHFIKVLSETWKETELRDVIIMDLVGTAMTLFLALIFHVLEWDEIKELIFLALVGGVCGVIASFTYRFFFVTSAKLYNKLEEKLEIAEAKINEVQNIKPLEIEALPAKKLSNTNDLYAGEFRIHNENQSVGGVKIRLIKAEPSLYTDGGTSDLCDLDSFIFPLIGVPDNTLNKDQECRVRIFTVERTNAGINLMFSGEKAGEPQKIFAPQYENNKLAEYCLTFETSATGVGVNLTKFKLLFSLDPQKPPFVLEKINPPVAAQSLNNGADGTHDKTKKHRDPVIVMLLICLSASLVVVAAAQRMQISKMANPPTPKNIAKKPLPDKIIPQPVTSNAPSIASPPQVTNVEPPMQFVTSNPSIDSGDSESELAKIKAKKLADIAAKKEADRKQTQSDSDNRWNAMLPVYKDCIETFYNILKKEADRRNEPIAKTDNYFNCLPSTINYELGETNIAEIRFSESTNVNFHIAITSGDQFQQRGLRISGSCGYFEIHHHPIYLYNRCVISVHIPDINEDRDVSLDQTHDLIEEDLRLLKNGQIAYLSQTNHTASK
jgi:hypothetical protein